MVRKKIQKNTKNISVLSQLDLFSNNKKRNKRKKLLKKLKKHIYILWQWSKVYKYFIGIWIFLLIGYIFLFSNIFAVKEIYIYRSDSLSDIDAAYRSLNYMRGDNIFFVDPSVIISRLKNTQKAIKIIDIRKKIPNTIEISLESYAPLFRIWTRLTLENGSIVQGNGVSRETLPEISLIPTPWDEEILNFNHLEKILILSDSLRKNILWLTIENIQYDTTAEEVLIRVNNGLILMFDIEKNIIPQIKKLTVFSSEKTDILSSFAVYIDLRVDGKIFTCEDENKNACRNTITDLYGKDYFDYLDKSSF